MHFRRGFTIVEIVIVMVIMGILLGLAVLNISSSQANTRDNERKRRLIAPLIEGGA